MADDGEFFQGLFVQARRRDPSYGDTSEALGTFSEEDAGTQLLTCGNNPDVSKIVVIDLIIKGGNSP